MTSSTRSEVPEVDDLVEQIRRNAEKPMESAVPLPAQTYLDPEFYAHEKSQVLRRDWNVIARVEQVPAAGDFITLDFLDEPIVVVRGDDDQVRVFSRVCRHRFADIVADRAGNVPSCGNLDHFECPYHMWSYRLDGELINAVDMTRSPGFDPARFNLVEVPSQIWQGFVFINLDGADTVPLSMESLTKQMETYDLSEWRLVGTHDFGVLPANWKLHVENFLEFYHHMGAHKDTVETLFPGLNTVVGDGDDPFTSVGRCPASAEGAIAEVDGYLVAPTVTQLPVPPGLGPADCAVNAVATRFPMFMLVYFPDITYWYQLTPLAADSHQLVIHALVHESNVELVDDEIVKKAYEFMVPVLDEDIGILERIQTNLSSGSTFGGALHEQEFPLLHMQRYLVHMLTKETLHVHGNV